MLENSILLEAQHLRIDLTMLFQQTIDESLSALKIKLDWEIEQEIRERISVLIFRRDRQRYADGSLSGRMGGWRQ